MYIKHNNKIFTYISTVVIREYKYDGLFEDNTYFICYDEYGEVESIPIIYCKKPIDMKIQERISMIGSNKSFQFLSIENHLNVK